MLEVATFVVPFRFLRSGVFVVMFHDDRHSLSALVALLNRWLAD
jgi:hypothetical protein